MYLNPIKKRINSVDLFDPVVVVGNLKDDVIVEGVMCFHLLAGIHIHFQYRPYMKLESHRD